MIRLLFVLPLVCTLFSCQGQNATDHATAADTPTEEAVPIYRDIDLSIFEELRLANDPNTILLDVRTPAEVAAGQIPGSISIDYRSSDFAEQIAQLDPEKTYLVYCKSGGRSGRACGMLQELQFPKVYNLRGGYDGWIAAQ